MLKAIKLFPFLGILWVGVHAGGVMVADQSQEIYLQVLSTAIQAEVSNQVAVIKTQQTFLNTTGEDAYAKYTFPIPQGASVTRFRWLKDSTWLEASFNLASQDTTLPTTNPFDSISQNLIAYLGSSPFYFQIKDTLPPDSQLTVELTYVELLPYAFDVVRFHYPGGYKVLDNRLISGEQSFKFLMESERDIDSVGMLNHSGLVYQDTDSVNISFTVGDVFPLNDIIVEYKLASDQLGLIPFSTYYQEGKTFCDSVENGFVGLIVEPESNDQTEVIEKVFILVIDESGSMGGDKMDQAKEASRFIVNRLNPTDYFNIISFDGDVKTFQEVPVQFNVGTQNSALNYINIISAGGGTNISGSLVHAVDQFLPASSDQANIIVFLTDGQASAGITDQQGILDAVSNQVDFKQTEIFLYTIGIGESVNTSLLTQLAIDNQGTAQFVDNNDVQLTMESFYRTIRNPVLLNTTVTFYPPLIEQVHPSVLPNLYKGMQLILAGKYTTPGTVVMTLSGTNMSGPVSYQYQLDLSAMADEKRAFLPKLWAKKKIDALTTQFYLQEEQSQQDSLKDVIEGTSLCYGVMSNFTSLVDNTGGWANVSTSIDSGEELLETTGSSAITFYPLPFNEYTKTTLYLNSPQRVEFRIFDAQGRLIKELYGDADKGVLELYWDGTDDSGSAVSNGIYFYKIQTADKQYYGKLIKE